jgi:hypothetical protein
VLRTRNEDQMFCEDAHSSSTESATLGTLGFDRCLKGLVAALRLSRGAGVGSCTRLSAGRFVAITGVFGAIGDTRCLGKSSKFRGVTETERLESTQSVRRN